MFDPTALVETGNWRWDISQFFIMVAMLKNKVGEVYFLFVFDDPMKPKTTPRFLLPWIRRQPDFLLQNIFSATFAAEIFGRKFKHFLKSSKLRYSEAHVTFITPYCAVSRPNHATLSRVHWPASTLRERFRDGFHDKIAHDWNNRIPTRIRSELENFALLLLLLFLFSNKEQNRDKESWLITLGVSNKTFYRAHEC